MRGTTYIALALGVSVAALTASSALAQQRPSAPSSADTNNTLEDIVVTAQRRAESVQTTPVAITAISGDQLRTRGIINVSDLAKSVPGLEQKPTTGTYSTGAYFIRGIGQKSLFNVFDPGVGIYIDDVYIGRTAFAGRDIYDLDRIEVLRGPQGTLYGRNSSGGAIKIVTTAPSDKFEGRGEASYGNYDRWSLDGVVNAPLADGIAVRISGSHREQDKGFTRLSTLGGTGNKDEANALRGSLRIQSGDLDWRVSADWQKQKADGRYLATLSDATVTLPSGLVMATAPYNRDELYVSDSPLKAFDRSREWGITSNLAYRLGAVTARSITAYRDSSSHVLLDASNGGVAFDVASDGHQFSQELQLVGQMTRLSWVVGLYYFNEHTVGDTKIGLPLIPLPLQDSRNDLNTDAYAAYAQGDYSITDHVKLTLGGRYSYERKHVDTRTLGFLDAFVYDNASVTALGLPTRISASKFTPKIGIQADVAPDVLAYASFTKGFKGGGFQSTAATAADFVAFNPEEVKAYEVGVKSELFDKRLRLNLSVYWNDYSDIQLDSLVGTSVLQLNVAQATVKGVELEFAARPASNWDVFGFVSYIDSRVDSVAPSAAAIGVPVGHRLNDTPEWQWQLGTSYRIDLGRTGSLTPRIQWSHSSSVWNTIAPPNPIQQIQPYSLVDARLRYEPDGKRFFIQAEIDNALNERYYTSRLQIAPKFPAVANNPRTFGVRAGFNF